MKKILLALTILPFSFLLKAQSISLGTDNEYCPNTEYEFTITLPKAYSSISATQFLITQQPYAFNASKTSFKFKGKFNDVNIKQVISVSFNNGNDTYPFEYKRVKSLFYPRQSSSSCPGIQPTQTTITAPLCKINTIPISFAAVKWYTEFENPKLCFGTITTYEYQLPAGWKLNNITSTGSNWIAGINNVTVTSDLSTGGVIFVRPANNCGSNLANGEIPVPIYINRPNSFSVSPANSPISCGSTTPVTFTINNDFNTTGITDFTWDLGTTPNGWLLANGIPAPAFYSTGLINTLTLTPACGATPLNVGAIVTVNGINCTASPGNVSIVQLPLSISGNSNFCNDAIYSIDNLPCNANSVNWELIPSYAGTLTVNNNQATLTPNGNYENVTLKANVTSSCFTNSVQVQKTITFGIPDHLLDILDGVVPMEGPYYTSTCYSFGARAIEYYPYYPYFVGVPYANSGTASYIWRLIKYDNYGGNVIYNLGTYGDGYGYGNSPDFCFNEPGEYDIVLDIINTSCTYHTRSFTHRFTVEDRWSYYSISPNPSSSNIKIAPNANNNTSKRNLNPLPVQAVEIIDKMGSVKYKHKFGKGLTTVNVDVNQLKNDIYTLRIFDGHKWHSYKIVIHH